MELATVLACAIVLFSLLIASKLLRRKTKLPKMSEDVLWRHPLTSSERFWLKWFKSQKYPGSNNLVFSVMCKFNSTDDVSTYKFRQSLAYVLRVVQLKNPLLQVGLEYANGDDVYSVTGEN